MTKYISALAIFVIFTIQSFSISPELSKMMREKGLEFPEINKFSANQNKTTMAEGYLVESVKVFHAEGNDDYTYTYNKANQILTQTKKYWNDDQPLSRRTTNTYDAKGNNLTVLIQDFELGDEDWQNISKASNTFNQKDSLLVYLKQNWNGLEWGNVSREINKYNSEGNSYTFTKEEWVQETQQWKVQNYSIFTYDENGNVTRVFSKKGFEGKDSRSIRTYDENANILSYTLEVWESGASIWREIAWGKYSYDSEGRITGRQGGNPWEYSYFITYSYDENGNLVNETSDEKYSLTFTYDNQNNLTELFRVEYYENIYPINDYLETYTYDENNKRLTYLRQDWVFDDDVFLPSSDGKWVNNYKYTYNSSGNLNSELKEIWENENWLNSFKKSNNYDSKNNLVSSISQAWEDDDWKNADAYFGFEDFYGNKFGDYRKYKIEVNWMLISSAKEISENIFDINIFPNPAQNGTTVKYNLEQNGDVRINITNINGKLINTFNQNYRTSGSHEIQISTDNLQTGQYFMTIEQNGIQSTKSFQVMK